MNYKINSSSENDIFNHLVACNGFFVPKLDSKVDLKEYSSKLFKKSTRFEAWDKSVLTGLVATYYNDHIPHIGFISNVSVLIDYSGKGIGSNLLKMCTIFGQNNNFHELKLEVSTKNHPAVKLYENHGFKILSQKEDSLTMSLNFLLSSNNRNST